MQMHRFTIKVQEALQNAQDIAAKENHGELKIVHLLISLLSDENSLVRPLMIKAGINLDALGRVLEEELKKQPKIFGSTNIAQLYLSQELMATLDKAAKIATVQKDEYISCEHLLLAILESASTSSAILENFGLRRENALRILAQLRGSMRITDEMPESKFQVLEKYAVNLTERARKG